VSEQFSSSSNFSFNDIRLFLNGKDGVNLGSQNISLNNLIDSAEQNDIELPNGDYVAPHAASEFTGATFSNISLSLQPGFGSLGVTISSSKEILRFEYNVQPRHAGLTWKNPYHYDLEYSFDYALGLPYYQVEYNAQNGQGFQPLSGSQNKIYQISGESSDEWRARGWERIKTIIESNGGNMYTVTIMDISPGGITVFQNLPANYDVQFRVYYTDGSFQDTDTTTVLISAAQQQYTASKANVHSTNPKNVPGYGCLWNADLAWSVFSRYGQLYICIGYLSTVNHGNSNGNSVRNATSSSLNALNAQYGTGQNNLSPFCEYVLLPLSTVNTWVNGDSSKVIFSLGYAFGIHPINFAQNGWHYRARLLSNNRIEVERGNYNGTGDTGSTMTLGALDCCLNIIAGRPNGTARSSYIFNYI
jgi:hypothetical protein